MNLFAVAIHLDQVGAMEFFQVMRKCRCRNIQLPADIADTTGLCGFDQAGFARLAAAG